MFNRLSKGDKVTVEIMASYGYIIFVSAFTKPELENWVRKDHCRRILVKDGVIIRIMKNRKHLSGEDALGANSVVVRKAPWNRVEPKEV